jgi:hypothetical protein
MMLARLRDALTDRDAVPPAQRRPSGNPADPGFPLGLDAANHPFPLVPDQERPVNPRPSADPPRG